MAKINQLEEIRQATREMGAKTVLALEAAADALINNDSEAALKARQYEKEVDAMYRMIDDRCITHIATQQPVAVDLRFLVATLKIASEIERIADYANNIAKLVQKKFPHLDLTPIAPMRGTVRTMADEAVRMLKDVVEAYDKGDVDFALDVRSRDSNVNKLNRELFRGILASATVNPWAQEVALDFHVAVRYLERVADRSTNVAEWVFYAVTGFRYADRSKM